MKPTHWLAFAAALAGCAVAYGVHLHGRQVKTHHVTASKPAASSDRRVAGLVPTAPPRVRPSSRPKTDALTQSPAKTPAPAPRQITGSPDRSPVMSEAQWRENAARVEMEANHELNRLSALLDLDPVQQDKVFASVARQSPYWLPGMQIGGPARSTDGAAPQADKNVSSPPNNRLIASNGNIPAGNVPSRNPTVNPPITLPVVTNHNTDAAPSDNGQNSVPDLTQYLNADQEQTLIEEEMDRQAWWAEVLPQLLPPNFGVAAAAAAVEAAAPATKEFEGGEVLLEE